MKTVSISPAVLFDLKVSDNLHGFLCPNLIAATLNGERRKNTGRKNKNLN